MQELPHHDYPTPSACAQFEMWYLSVGFLKGLTRLFMLYLLILDSFFEAAKCSFPDGYESWDTSHCVFACFVMERVQQDQRRLQQERELQQVVFQSERRRKSVGPPSSTSGKSSNRQAEATPSISHAARSRMSVKVTCSRSAPPDRSRLFRASSV